MKDYGPNTRKNISEVFMKNFTKRLTHLSFFMYSLSSKNIWRICEEYVTVYCLKFYIILNKFKSVWIYPKLRRILNNRMTLNAIEIWNLNRFKGTYKHEKIKNQKQRKRVFYEYSLWKKGKMDSEVYYHEMQNGYLFWQMQQEKIQHENLQVMINITFLILYIIRGFFIYLFHIMINQEFLYIQH